MGSMSRYESWPLTWKNRCDISASDIWVSLVKQEDMYKCEINAKCFKPTILKLKSTMNLCETMSSVYCYHHFPFRDVDIYNFSDGFTDTSWSHYLFFK